MRKTTKTESIMKIKIAICLILFLSITTWSQAPQKISYQSVIRNNSNALIVNSTVGMKVSILQGGENGVSVYSETHTPTTNANGLVSLAIGTGTVVQGIFANIDWSTGSYFVKTEIDPTGGVNYTLVGTSELLSVPFALHAKTSGSGGTMPSGTTNGEMLYYNNGEWVKIPPGKNHQTLHFCNGVPRWDPCAPDLPTVITKAGETTINSVTMLGKIESEGGSYIKSKGFVYSEFPKPTIDMAYTTRIDKGMGSEDFSYYYSPNLGSTRVFTGVYYRAYAINDTGVSYGQELFFESD